MAGSRSRQDRPASAGVSPRPAAAGCSSPRRTALYDPRLDLAVLAPDGSVVGHSLSWRDPVTGVGLVEPVRVEDEHAGRGIGYAMISAGLDRLARAGARPR